MRVLSVTELENVYGGSEASYDAGDVGDFFRGVGAGIYDAL